ncbi:NADH-quinone oxidoreductase subunit NuoG [Coxiella endosymbiont of Amblyomma americanum]|uniref:NADH-quinone oxidoreductase subunit NuoG n=1 Tax=Coxiella endosymbiont of Amblyomma americanum TaxID=325775 RepID=UPI00057DCDD7|nr:NADH-quinone oxidoreductase subunit NuoG [Coxiella endosymbiont of Amblyomma americanum]AJC50274.1 NADH dehydrogenase [Coxiella endosymbiont of Amblyomma americanum]
MVELEIDNKKTIVETGISLIEAAEKMGIYIPRFCYHKKLSIAANCRMCLVEVEGSQKLLPACAVPVITGMKVFTRTEKTIESQRFIMELFLINHPLDCPICDQGGECELQDLAMGFGGSHSSYEEEVKRVVFSENISPLIETDITRCIQCTRCVRFGEEIAGLPELGVINRGEKVSISTYIKNFLISELSGNIIDICPVGALTDKPARYRGRGWELHEIPTIAPHDCVGSNIFLHSRHKDTASQCDIMRSVPRENEEVNEVWISDRDRFSHCGLYHSSRIYQPKIKKEQRWITVSWEEAFQIIKDRTQVIIKKNGVDQLGGLLSSSASIEELYLFQKWLRGLGSFNIDHRVRWQDFRDQDKFSTFPSLGISIAEIEKLDAVLLIGSNIRFEQPLISHRINKACHKRIKVLAINPMDFPFIFSVEEKIIVSPKELPNALAQVAKVLGANFITPKIIGNFFSEEESKAKTIADILKKSEKVAILLGEHALHHENASIIRALAQFIGQKSGASVGFLTEGANSAGAWLVGAIPHRGPAGKQLIKMGLDAKAMLMERHLKAYFILNLELDLDAAYPAAAMKALRNAEFVVSLVTFTNPAMENYSDIILPVAPFSETEGTFVNVEGRLQSFSAASIPERSSQVGWKILRVLGNYFELSGFDYRTIQDIRHEISLVVPELVWNIEKKIEMQHSYFTLDTEYTFRFQKENFKLTRLAPWPMVRIDNLVRRSKPLQEILKNQVPLAVGLNSETASKLGFKEEDRIAVIQNDSRIILPLVIEHRLANNTVFLASGLDQTAGFGQAETEIILEKI